MKPNWDKLRIEYETARQKGENMLRWCSEKASIYGMSYGEFVRKLNR